MTLGLITPPFTFAQDAAALACADLATRDQWCQMASADPYRRHAHRNSTSKSAATPSKHETLDLYQASTRADPAIADLCAQTVCFLWFESLTVLNEATHTSFPAARMPQSLAIAKKEFLVWTRTVLQTTQVSCNVVILAMLYIFRLKLSNPSVKGKAGSEYRLLTVALMLGNKFLDDNTYTNKTWSDVTAIPIKEIQLMEIEFLSNMRYQLMVTAEDWRSWLVKINCFRSYARCQQRLLESAATATALGLPSPPTFFDVAPAGPISTAPPPTERIIQTRSTTQMLHPNQAAAMSRIPYGQAPLQPYLPLGASAMTMAPSRKRSLDPISAEQDLPRHSKRIMSQPTTPQKSSRLSMPYMYNPQTGMPMMSQQTLPPLPTVPTTSTSSGTDYAHNWQLPIGGGGSGAPTRPTTYAASMASALAPGQGLSPASLRRSPAPGASPALSPVSRFSMDSSHRNLSMTSAGNALSGSHMARHSPYGPTVPVARLVNRFQPEPSQMTRSTDDLWYYHLSSQQDAVYRGRVPNARVSPQRPSTLQHSTLPLHYTQQ